MPRILTGTTGMYLVSEGAGKPEPCSENDALHQNCRCVSQDGTEQDYPAATRAKLCPAWKPGLLGTVAVL